MCLLPYSLRLFEIFRYLHYESIISTSLRTLSWDFKDILAQQHPPTFQFKIQNSANQHTSERLKSLESSETREEFALPTFTMCNYQAHSKHKIKDLYPFVRTRFLRSKSLTVRFSQQPEMPIRNLIKAQGWSISCILRRNQMMH